jgi:Putative peptidoglycan binding domain
MGLRFDRSRGVIGLVRWHVRESALMFRLGLHKLADYIGSRNVRNPAAAALDTRRSHPSLFSRWIAARSTETRQSSQPSDILESEIQPILERARLGRMLLKIAFMAALFLGGYLTGHLAVLEGTPTADANTNQALAAPAAPESVAPLALASPVTVLPEASSVPAPVSEVTASKSVSTPIWNTRPLTSDEVLEMQAWLKAFGFDPGPLDGLPGPQTIAAVKRYRAARQMEETEALDRSVLQQVRQQVGQSSR